MRMEWSIKVLLAQRCPWTSRVAGGRVAVLGSTAVIALACANPSSTPRSDVDVHRDEDASSPESGTAGPDASYKDTGLRDVVVDSSVEDVLRPGRPDARNSEPPVFRDAADGACYRDPYVPNQFEPPCELEFPGFSGQIVDVTMPRAERNAPARS
jgi:hypothetical protein